MRPLVAGTIAALAACNGGEEASISVSSVDPPDGHVAFPTRLTVRGSGFARGAAAFLAREGWTRVPLADVLVAGPDRLEATVPAGQPAGVYAVQVEAGGAHSEPGGSFTLYAGELEITALDVDQGDATLIRAPSGRSLLVDGGKPLQGTGRVIPFLNRVGAGRPDFIVVTHFDDDHLGGVVEYLAGADGMPGSGDERWPRLGLYDHGDNHGCDSASCAKYYALVAAAREKMPLQGGEARGLVAGERIPLGGGVRVTVVAVNGLLPTGARIPTSDENENSVALLIEFGDFRYLTAGDLYGGPASTLGRSCTAAGADVEGPLAALVGDVSVLRVSHHGSCTSTNPVALDRLRPEVAILSVGRDNAYCHPDQRVLELLHASGAKSYFTTQGMVTASSKCTVAWGGTASDPPLATSFPPSAAAETGDIQIRTADGSSYRVRVVSTDGSVQLRQDTYSSKP